MTSRKYFMLISPVNTKRVLLLLLLLLLFVISCMQGIYNDTNHVPTAIPTAQASSFRLQHFLQYVSCS